MFPKWVRTIMDWFPSRRQTISAFQKFRPAHTVSQLLGTVAVCRKWGEGVDHSPPLDTECKISVFTHLLSTYALTARSESNLLSQFQKSHDRNRNMCLKRRCFNVQISKSPQYSIKVLNIHVYKIKPNCIIGRCRKLPHTTRKRHVNPLKTKRRLLYLKTQFVPRSKHLSYQL